MVKKEKELYYQAELLEYQISQVQQYIEELNQRLAEAQGLREALGEFEKLEEGAEGFFPLANGVFLKGKVLDVKNLKVNVGGNVVVNKTVAEAKALVEEQVVNLKKVIEETSKQLDSLVAKAGEVSEELASLNQSSA